MLLIFHESAVVPARHRDAAGRLRSMLQTAGHELRPFEGASMPHAAADAVVALFPTASDRRTQGDLLAWAGRQGIKTVALEPDLEAISGNSDGAFAADLAAFDRVVTFEPCAYEPLQSLFRGSDALHCFAPFLDVAPSVAAARDAAFHRQNLAARLVLPRDVPWILADGSADLADGLASFQQLSQALSKVLMEPWALLLRCEGRALGDVEAQLRWLPRDRVWNLDAAANNNRAGIFAACDLFVWPAIGAACGPALLEAQAAGLPVVAEKNDLTQHYVADGITGKLYPPGNFASLANQISFLLRHANFRESLRLEALKSTPELFGLLRAARDFNHLLDAL